jgi:hypothetical protein
MDIPDECPWRELCDAALLELDPTRLPQRIAVARSAILQRIEVSLSKVPDSEQIAMRDALETLNSLAKIAKRDLGEPK